MTTCSAKWLTANNPLGAACELPIGHHGAHQCGHVTWTEPFPYPISLNLPPLPAHDAPFQRECSASPSGMHQWYRKSAKHLWCDYCREHVEASEQPAHDAPQVERFDCFGDDFVRYAEYLTIQAVCERLRAEKQQIEAEINAALVDAQQWEERAEAAESSLATLREAVREWKEAHETHDGTSRGHSVLLRAEAKLRALVTPQGEAS